MGHLGLPEELEGTQYVQGDLDWDRPERRASFGTHLLARGGATISLAVSSDDVFAPPGEYDVLFVAWEEVTENEVFLHMERWRKDARKVLNSSWGYR